MKGSPTKECNDNILEIKGLTKKFGGVIATRNLDLVLKRNELRCIIGPNGAGKSTLFNLITGFIRPNSGSIIYEGNEVIGLTPDKLCRMGIGRKFQVPNVFFSLPVMDNLKLALYGTKGIKHLFEVSSSVDNNLLEKTLDTIGLKDKNNMIAEQLSHGEKQWLEIGMVMINSPALMLLDEPTAGMTPEETAKTAELILKIKNTLSIIVIEHDINFIKQISKTVTVLHRGSKLAEGTFEEVSENEEVRDVYFGRSNSYH